MTHLPGATPERVDVVLRLADAGLVTFGDDGAATGADAAIEDGEARPERKSKAAKL